MLLQVPWLDGEEGTSSEEVNDNKAQPLAGPLSTNNANPVEGNANGNMSAKIAAAFNQGFSTLGGRLGDQIISISWHMFGLRRRN